MTHTPGPWWNSGRGAIRFGQNVWIETTISWRNKEANARLIAAAPDLLAALKLAGGYVQKVEGQLRPTMGDNLVTPDLRKIEAAIAKATSLDVLNRR